jgi:hypothetical protein
MAAAHRDVSTPRLCQHIGRSTQAYPLLLLYPQQVRREAGNDTTQRAQEPQLLLYPQLVREQAEDDT